MIGLCKRITMSEWIVMGFDDVKSDDCNPRPLTCQMSECK
jgi:hypothetical protein